MSAFESELENLLGEFHIRMKGEPQRSERVADRAARPGSRSASVPSLHRCSLLPSSGHHMMCFLYSDPLFVSLFSGRSGRFRPAVSRRPVRGRSLYLTIPKTQQLNHAGSSTEERDWPGLDL